MQQLTVGVRDAATGLRVAAGLSWFYAMKTACGRVIRRLRSPIVAHRRPLVVAVHAVLIICSSYLACWLRFDGAIPPDIIGAYLQTLPWVLVIRGAIFLAFGLYGSLWRYTGIWDVWRIFFAVFSSSVAVYVLVYAPLGAAAYPRSLILIDSILLVCSVAGVRLLRRSVPAVIRGRRGRPVLIIGAGDAGEMIVREMRKGRGYRPVGFIDDDVRKVGRTIHGFTVLGTRDDLARVLASSRPSEVLVAMPSAGSAVVRSLVEQLQQFKLPITTLPSLSEIVDGRVSVKQIRPLEISDLLPRTQVALDTGDTLELIQGKRVLVTGAGGSIGSELCRQIAALDPASLILVERYENSLYAIANDLADRGHQVYVRPIVGDITDAGRIDEVFAAHRPQIVFHAAAHKHVPLMEANPCEAVKNNVVGTQTVAEAALRYGVDRFVLISTDKAANPSSVMGASKRVAELIVQSASARGRTRFVSVRFGNVLGSNGSVIPRMLDQIRAGGPVTVTHPEIRRYFMLIPEAVQLVLRAAVSARGGETFVLDMGEQLKVLDVAKNLIRLCGFVPDHEIPITFIGLRPGEKLAEELTGDGEMLERSETDKLMRLRWPASLSAAFADEVAALVGAATGGRSQEVLRQLRHIVPTFIPDIPESAAGVAVSRELPGETAPRRRPVSVRALPGGAPFQRSGTPNVAGAVANALRSP